MSFSKFAPIANLFQLCAAGLLALVSLAMLIVTCLSFAGVLPWLDVSAAFGQTELPRAGQAMQIGGTVLLVILASYLPSSYRVVRLEHAHRRFQIDMDDITRAYRAAHMADRAETFEMRREFDAVRERYKYLKDQPSLSEIDDELLVIASQMSEQSRDLAERFSDGRMDRIRTGLKHRTDDIAALELRIKAIKAEAVHIAKMRDQMEISEDDVIACADKLQSQLAEIAQPLHSDSVVRFRKH